MLSIKKVLIGITFYLGYTVLLNLPIFDTTLNPPRKLEKTLYFYYVKEAAPISAPEFIDNLGLWTSLESQEFQSSAQDEHFKAWFASDDWQNRPKHLAPSLTLRTPYKDGDYYQMMRALALKEAILNHDAEGIVRWAEQVFDTSKAIPELSQHIVVDLAIFSVNLSQYNKLINNNYLAQFVPPEKYSMIKKLNQDYNAFLYDNLTSIKKNIEITEQSLILSEADWWETLPDSATELDPSEVSYIYSSNLEKFIYESGLIKLLDSLYGLVSQENHTHQKLIELAWQQQAQEVEGISLLKLALYPYDLGGMITLWIYNEEVSGQARRFSDSHLSKLETLVHDQSIKNNP